MDIVAGRGQAAPHVHILQHGRIGREFGPVLGYLEDVGFEQVVLQYTPNAFSEASSLPYQAILRFWRACAKRWNTSLIVHETYFREWWYPPSWLKGSLQKVLLQSLVRVSRSTFSASQPLVNEMRAWVAGDTVHRLPIGSNFGVAECGRDEWRKLHGLGRADIVLVLFGGGNALKWAGSCVTAVDRLLHRNHVRCHWLLLGGVSPDWFRLRSPVIVPGRLPEAAVSAWLQASDIFLMPHYHGLCAKRGTLMAAMQHGLPIVGTRGAMTDAFWVDACGVTLARAHPTQEFAERVLRLAIAPDRRRALGQLNREYHQSHLSWDRIARDFLDMSR